MAANDNDIHKALRELCTKVGGLDATVCNLQTSLEHGRSEAIRRRESLESRVEEIVRWWNSCNCMWSSSLWLSGILFGWCWYCWQWGCDGGK